ncbi:MAG: hypothetical protein HFE35_05080 [Clostridia bacterium]|jgi:hypothetical protein|uniref:hypothetical protein n=1 Tax=Pumilibacter muris TaxID=2941510 RepID=UPI00203C21AC|nr:hypothetical protein [Pumilibacter muris]MCI8596170.1 hypothetical protein [Clostridia bacterium]
MAKAFSPEFVREQSRQNLSEMSRIVDKLYDRADNAEAREAIASMSSALQGIRPTGTVVQTVLDVERLLKKVLLEYNGNLDENKAEGVDAATVKIINQIVSTRKKMCGCTMDADKKRGLKTYLKANKGAGSKKELKLAYEDRYASAMEEASRYVENSKLLEQLVKSYQLQTLEMSKQSELDTLNAEIKKLAAKYKQATDQVARDRMNKEYQTLLNKKKSLDVSLINVKNAQSNVNKVDTLLKQLKDQAEIGAIDNVDIEQLADLSANVAKGLKKMQQRTERAEDAYGAATSAMDSVLNRNSETAGRGATLDDVIMSEQAASLDDIAGGAALGAESDIPSLDDIALD